MKMQRSPSAGAFEPNPRRPAGTPIGVAQRSPSAGLFERVPSSPQLPQRGLPPSRGGCLENVATPSFTPVSPGAYKKGDLVEYFSATHRDWLPAVIVNIDAEGKIIIDLKPNTWLGKDEQTSKIRLRRKCVPDPAPQRPASHRAPSPVRQRSASREAPSGAPGQAGAGTPRSRDASPAPVGSRQGTPWRQRSDTPSRAASPRAGAPGSGNGTPRSRPPGIPRVADSPGVRRRSAVGAAGMAIAGA